MRRWVLAGSLLALVFGALSLVLLTGFLSPPAGPVGAQIREPEMGSYSEGFSVLVGQPVTFGGYPTANGTGAPERILAVVPTNRPAHVVLRTGVMLGPPYAAASVGWGARHELSLPVNVMPSRLPHVWLPTLGMAATRPGVYVVQGLLVSYESLGRRYQVYLPDQFVLCAGRTHPLACPVGLAPSPPNWPAVQLPLGL